MRHITNILLLLTLICYVFLPFHIMSIQGSVSGMNFTAGEITRIPTFRHVALVLIPFISCFFAIGFNCLKNKWWTLVSICFILLGFLFFARTGHLQDVPLEHAPDVAADEANGEGFSAESLGIGFKLSLGLLCLSLISAVMSLLPLKINKKIDRAFAYKKTRLAENVQPVDVEVAKEKKETPQPKTETEAETPQEPTDDHARFMPPGQGD